MTSGHAAATTSTAPQSYFSGWRMWVFLIVLLFVSMFCQIDRILPFILAESIRADLALSDTQIGLMTGLAFAVCYTLLSLPLARASDGGSPRIVLVACVLGWSVMTALGGLATSFLVLAFTRFGVAFGEAGAIPASHALIARRIAPARRGMAIGLFSMGIPLGTMVGFAAGGAVADTLGWRVALMGAGLMGLVFGVLVLAVARPTPQLVQTGAEGEPFLRASLRLLSSAPFRWLMIGGVAVGFASGPFYAFTAPFLIRTHGLTASEVGLAFGLLQGLMGVVGTLLGGRGFDRASRAGRGLLGPPAVLFLVSSVTTAAALFAPLGWMSILLFVPGMLSFAFMLPWAFGAAHRVAGEGREALASSLVLIASGLLGPTLGPLFVGMISDATPVGSATNGLAIALLIVPAASVLTGMAMLIANQRLSLAIRQV